ncbi:MAG: dihydroorotase family protein [Candidatus Hydrothermarchaeales archaeon]
MLLRNCKIISPKGLVSGDILIENGRIKEIKKSLEKRGEEALNAKGKPVIPGLIDAHTHMRDFKEKQKEDFTSGSKAALAGGITTILDMPNTDPPVTAVAIFKRRIDTANRSSLVDFGINFGISNNPEEIEKVSPASYKIYMDGTLGDVDENMEKAFKKCRRVSVHAEDSKTIKRNTGYVRDRNDFLSHAEIREPKAEIDAVKRACELAEGYKKRTHICHISSRKSLGHLNPYTTSEVTPHHLFLTEEYLRKFKGFAKTNPPLRTKMDLYGLWDALKNGKIDIVASDHAPHTLEEKEMDVLECPPGIPNLDVMLKLMLRVVKRGTITLVDITRLMSENPARIFGIKNKGTIEVGKDADLVILDLKKEGKVEPGEFYSKAKYSPFEDWKTVGDVDTVILRGKIAFKDNDFWVKKGYGEYLGSQV